MGFVRRVISGALDLANLKKHNDNFADIETDLTEHNGRIANAQTEITTHRASEQAHAAEAITYEGAVVGANNTQDAIDALKETVDNVIVEGGDGTQAAAAAVSVSGTAHPTLKQRVDTEYLETNAKFSEVNAQLADTGKQVMNVEDRRFYSDRIVKHNKRRPLITILDDDTRIELYTKLYPIMFAHQA